MADGDAGVKADSATAAEPAITTSDATVLQTITTSGTTAAKTVSFGGGGSGHIPAGFNPLSPRMEVLAAPVARNAVIKRPPDPIDEAAIQKAIQRQEAAQTLERRRQRELLYARRATTKTEERERERGFDGTGGVDASLQESSESAIPPGSARLPALSPRVGLESSRSGRSARSSHSGRGFESSRQSFSTLFAARANADSALPLSAPLQPTGSRRILLNSSANTDSWALALSQARDAQAIANMKSYYDTHDPPAGLVYAHLITNNPRRDAALEHKRAVIERDNQSLLELRTSKAFRSPYGRAPNGRIAFPEVRSRLKHNNDRQRQLYNERLQRENALYWERIGRQKHHVVNEKPDHDFHLGRTVMYPVIIGTDAPAAQRPPRTASDAANSSSRRGGGRSADAGASPEAGPAPPDDGAGHAETAPSSAPTYAMGMAPTPPQTAPQQGLAPPRRRMTAVG